jgi:5-methylcytosine-specific restriction endonuclease McrA
MVGKKRWTPYFSRRGHRIFVHYSVYYDTVWDQAGRYKICPKPHRRHKDAQRCVSATVRNLQLRRSTAFLTDVVPPRLTRNRTLVNRTPIEGLNSEVWRFIREMYDNRCYYCGKGGGLLQREHRIPLARGGENDISNIVPACENCNRRKGIKTDDEFFKLLSDKWEYNGTDDGSTQPARPFPGEMSLDGRAVRIPLQRRKRVNLELPPGMKLCSACHKVLTITEFGSHRGKKDGLASRCKNCSAAVSKAWREANPEKWAAMKKQSRRPLGSEMNAEWNDNPANNVEEE